MLDDRLERALLFEQMRGTGDDKELFLAAKIGERCAIECEHLEIVAANDQ